MGCKSQSGRRRRIRALIIPVNILSPYPILSGSGYSYEYRNASKASSALSSNSLKEGFLPYRFTKPEKLVGIWLICWSCRRFNSALVSFFSWLNKNFGLCSWGIELLPSSRSKHFRYCSTDNAASTTYPRARCDIPSERESSQTITAQCWNVSALSKISAGSTVSVVALVFFLPVFPRSFSFNDLSTRNRNDFLGEFFEFLKRRFFWRRFSVGHGSTYA